MICPNCRHENRPSAKFCGQCRTKLPRVCPGCGAEVVPGNPFCDECGAEISSPSAVAEPPRPATLEAGFAFLQQSLPQTFREQLLTGIEGENRLVTVLFADMSGSLQRTSALHPEDAAQLMSGLLQAMVDVLLQHGGRVDRFLGDGLLAVFGAPQAHESDPERAILAALAIREAAGKLGLDVTAGIHTGEVYVGGVGSERHQEVTVMGPVVHLASRLQGHAEPGQILVGEATYRPTRRAFAFTPLALEIKGIEGTATAYMVERPLPRPEKARGIDGLRAELIGRDEEFAKLQEALTALRHGQGQMVTLIGEAGVGKSRLVAELKQALGVRRWALVAGAEAGPPATPKPQPLTPNAQRLTPLWLEGRCLELSMTASYWPFLDIFRDYFAWGPDEVEADRAGRLVAALRELVSRRELSEARFEEIGPLLGHLLAVRFGTAWDERLKNAGPEEIKHRTFTAIRDFFLALSRRQPLLLVLEDLHWADSLSLDLISLLMETVTFAPLMLLCVYRPEREHKCSHLSTIAARKCSERYTEITLRELSAAQSRRLIESLLTIENLPAPVKDAILQKSGGNPFFVEEVVRSLIASGMVYQEGDVWRAKAEIASIAVPDTIQSVILSRVDRLERDLKRVLQSAAVIGRLFRRRLLEYTTREQAALERHLWELEEQALIYQERAVPEEEYSFKHVLTQETIYQSILRRRRAAFHQQVGEAIEALYQDGLEEYYEQLAYHYERSGADEKAVEYLLKAGEKARRAYLNDEAIGYFQRALERLERTALGETRQDWRLAALQGLGQTYQGVGRAAEAAEQFRHAMAVGKELGLDAQQLVRFYFWLGDVLFWQSQFDEMIRIGQEGLALLGDDTESVGAALMNQTIAGAHALKGDQRTFREISHRTARFLPRLPYSEELRPAYHHITEISWRIDKNAEEARRWLETLRQHAEQAHDWRALGTVHHGAAGLAWEEGDLHGSLSRNEEALRILSQIGDAKHQSWCLSLSAGAFLQLGDLQRAEECARQALPAVEQMGMKRDMVRSWQMIASVMLCRGDAVAAREAGQRALQLWQESGSPNHGAAIHLLGRVALARGERSEAAQYFQEALLTLGRDAERLPAFLSGLDEALADPGAVEVFCRRFRETHPEASASSLVQWFLEPAQPAAMPCLLLVDPFAVSLDAGWTWQDLLGDCSYTLQDGLEIHAPNGRDLRRLNLSAPRLLRPVSGDFALQMVCVPASEAKPAIGGLLLWKDKENYLRLDRGTRGKHEISFQGCLANEDTIFGRGRLVAERLFLRLERVGGRVRALSSADGAEWLTAGEVEFPVEDPVEIGLHAIGNIDRLIYPGAYPDGTAIRFESFEIWGP